MKKTLGIVLLLFVFLLSGCTEKDEFGQEYDTASHDLREALEDMSEVNNAKVKVINHYYEEEPYTIEFDDDLMYHFTSNTYYKYVSLNTFNVISRSDSGWDSEEKTVVVIGYLLRIGQGNIFKETLEDYDVDNAVIEGDYYVLTYNYADWVKRYVRIDSLGQIDYFKHSEYSDDIEEMHIEFFISNIDSVEIELPDYN